MMQTIFSSVRARIPTAEGEFWLYHYQNPRDQKEHLAVVMGEVAQRENLLVRVHSECFTGDVLGSRRCDCGEQLQFALQRIAQEGSGVLIYLRQEGRGIGLAEKLRAYNLQDQGYDTVEANLLLGHQADARDYAAAAAILADLQVRSIRLITNNPAKVEQLTVHGVQITERVAAVGAIHADNARYLATKVQKMRHLLTLPEFTLPEFTLPAAQSLNHTEDSHLNGAPLSTPTATGTPEQAAIDAALYQLQRRIVAHPPRNRTHNHPFVTLSYAQSLDGSIAAQPGQPLRLSSAGSMRVTHALRTLHAAILVGVGTVLADNPRLTARSASGEVIAASPRPVILDSHLRTPLESALFQHPKPPIFATTHPNPKKAAHIQQAGGLVLSLPTDASGGVNLPVLLEKLGELGINSLMVEGGARILTNFWQQRLADYAVITIAPRLVGGVRPVDGNGTGGMVPLKEVLYTSVDGDMMVWGACRDADWGGADG